ncbi:hypothetical protein W97_05077 [Coniosporium apollinis CBS 100218]|uniref:Mei2-like C-terminal RNA recognition motif domain-containing protein n=1 Tax=Coniosporium apollinis (strain CBS 100218) TaxID=1168221 RepID=R7YV75_CONA1|nr:uncharacterized protein W97_05077 [Coniosporium apollinis CBS 100218]EON65835.1 hypothetical protein W97_05077 [Coniosporium apollinis CBS 100218]
MTSVPLLGLRTLATVTSAAATRSATRKLNLPSATSTTVSLPETGMCSVVPVPADGASSSCLRFRCSGSCFNRRRRRLVLSTKQPKRSGAGLGGPRPLACQAAPRHHHDTEEHANNRDNRIDLRRIQAGEDVRTTIMLRNISTKMRHDELKGLLDEKVRGLYDFMYLRMDFDNSCDGGYASISFVRFEDIVTFFNASLP